MQQEKLPAGRKPFEVGALDAMAIAGSGYCQGWILGTEKYAKLAWFCIGLCWNFIFF